MKKAGLILASLILVSLTFFILSFFSLVFSVSFVSAGELRVTEEHPFLVDEGWISASQLRIGDILQTVDGKKVRITSLEDVVSKENFSVYNLEAKEYSDFVVSSDNLIVHNSGKIPWWRFGNNEGSIQIGPVLKKTVKMGPYRFMRIVPSGENLAYKVVNLNEIIRVSPNGMTSKNFVNYIFKDSWMQDLGINAKAGILFANDDFSKVIFFPANLHNEGTTLAFNIELGKVQELQGFNNKMSYVMIDNQITIVGVYPVNGWMAERSFGKIANKVSPYSERIITSTGIFYKRGLKLEFSNPSSPDGYDSYLIVYEQSQ